MQDVANTKDAANTKNSVSTHGHVLIVSFLALPLLRQPTHLISRVRDAEKSTLWLATIIHTPSWLISISAIPSSFDLTTTGKGSSGEEYPAYLA